MHARYFVSFGLAVAMIAGPSTASAWGDRGHRTVVQIALNSMKPETRAGIEALLGEPADQLLEYASWADAVRRDRSETGPWHYINYPISQDKPDFDIYNQPGGNVVWAIGHHAAIVADATTDTLARQESLKFLIHFVGDMHQPLHIGSGEDLGANRVRVTYGEHSANLHSIWDSYILNDTGMEPADLASMLVAGLTAEEVAAIQSGTTYDWMIESRDIAQEVAYGNFPQDVVGDTLTTESLGLLRDMWGDDSVPEAITWNPRARRDDLPPGPDLSGEYADKARPVIQKRLMQGGLRLGHILDELFANPPILPKEGVSRLPTGN